MIKNQFIPDEKGFYGNFGGAYIPELLYPNIESLKSSYKQIVNDDSFKEEFKSLLQKYVGRPSPLYYAKNLSDYHGFSVYLKREDLNHTGAHKINNTIGQILLAERMGKTRIIAETGAGQHGVATATVCALKGLECHVYMGKTDVKRQMKNVNKMKLLGAEVIPVESGNMTLKDATNEAIRDWIKNPEDTYYVIGSVVGPHPYPEMVAYFQSVISQEIICQLKEETGTPYPDRIVACIGGGSNAAGAFYHFVDQKEVKLHAVEAAGKGVDSGETAATILKGRQGVFHGSKTLLMQTDDGQVVEPYSISAGLDYPGIGPVYAYLNEIKRVNYSAVTDAQALDAGFRAMKLEGIVPALESAHALASLTELPIEKNELVVVNLSGNGDKDMETYQHYFQLLNPKKTYNEPNR
jgi:tryptophan synthase beta chain